MLGQQRMEADYLVETRVRAVMRVVNAHANHTGRKVKTHRNRWGALSRHPLLG